MGVFNSINNVAKGVLEDVYNRAMKVQEYTNEYYNLSDQGLLDELNKERELSKGFSGAEAQKRVIALNRLLKQRGYYYAGEGKLKKQQ